MTVAPLGSGFIADPSNLHSTSFVSRIFENVQKKFLRIVVDKISL